jgi:hypothetical protein
MLDARSENPDYWLALLRQRLPRNDPLHEILGPLEHREFTRDVARTDPLLRSVAMLPFIPAYTGVKYLAQRPDDGLLRRLARTALGGAVPRSPASLDEIFAGYEGLFSGLKERLAPAEKVQPRLTKRAIYGTLK